MIPTASTILQLDLPDSVDQAVDETITYLPKVLGALLILIVGYIIGRIVGAIVTRVLMELRIGRFTPRPRPEDGPRTDSLARVLGKLAAYYVYFVALLAAANVLEIAALSELLAEIGAYLPVIFGALVVLVIGFVAGRIIGDFVAGFVSDLGLDNYFRETPLERISDRSGEFGRLVGTLVSYYVYLVTLLAVADILEIDALSVFLTEFVEYVPALIGGLVVLLVGIWIAERVAEMIEQTDEGRTASLAALGVKILIYYIVVTIVLGVIGFETAVLTTLFTAFVVTFFGALAIALALGIGIAVGLGGQDYVAENVDDWMDSLSSTVSEDGTDRFDDTDSGSAQFDE